MAEQSTRRAPRPGALLFAALGALVVLAALAAGGLLFLVPLAVLLAPLLLGRYVGEARLARLLTRLRPRRAPRARPATPATHGVDLGFRAHGLLAAFRLAERGPPTFA